MGLDVRRHIEVCTEDIVGTYDKRDIPKLGKLTIGDIILVYNPDKSGENYMRITKEISVDETNTKFVYEVIDSPKTLEDAVAFNPDIALHVEYTKKLPKTNIKFKENDIIKVYSGCNPEYYKYTAEGIWESIESAPKSWKGVVYTNDEGELTTAIDNLRGSFVDNYIYGDWYQENDDEFVGRGLPSDVSDVVKSNITDGEFKISYITLTELNNLIHTIKQKYENSIKEKIQKEIASNIDIKLDTIIKLIQKETITNESVNKEDDEYDDIDEIIEDNYYAFISASNESHLAESFAHNLAGVWSDDNIRIIYAFNN